MDDDALTSWNSRRGRTPAHRRQGGADNGAGRQGTLPKRKPRPAGNKAGAAFPFSIMAYFPCERCPEFWQIAGPAGEGTMFVFPSDPQARPEAKEAAEAISKGGFVPEACLPNVCSGFGIKTCARSRSYSMSREPSFTRHAVGAPGARAAANGRC
jgi:hypothetical protein